MSLWLVLLMQAVPDAPLVVVLPRLTPACRGAQSDDIVVCADRSDRYRLPLPVDQPDPDRHVAGEAASAASALRPGGACGLFAGQRACAKAEAARYGYGRGRDPVTVLGRLGRKLLDPDADLDEPRRVP